MRTVAAPTLERQRTTGYRRVANSRPREGYRGTTAVGTAVRIPDYTRPYPSPIPKAKPMPKAAPKATPAKKVLDAGYSKAKRTRILRTFCQIAGVFLMCSIMIYRYAMILESNDRIAKMQQQVAEMEYDNQYLAAKLDSALELGALETYAIEELGMIRPDNSQIFYVDINMEDTTVENGEETKSLQGVPGALVHAIRVLK